MIAKETCEQIWSAYREITMGEKMLADLAKQRDTRDDSASTLPDSFGRRRRLQLGIPTGDNAHMLFDVSTLLAESVIRAHIESKRAELASLNERARIELGP